MAPKITTNPVDFGIGDKLSPLKEELPSSFAERLGRYYSSQVSDEYKKQHGQFFTPADLARFMASLSLCSKSTIRILDPGCGVAILTCALSERLQNSHKHLSKIVVVAYETDHELIPLAHQSLSYLKKWLAHHNVEIDFTILSDDFLLSNSDTLENQERSRDYFDLIISNPPYFKLPKEDARARAANAVVHGQPNIYSIFLYIAATLLVENGQLIFITPRSFSSGFYFRLFRAKFFSLVQLDAVHLFDSRKEAFLKDDVLQENVVISARRMKANGKRPAITVSFSQGLRDLESRRVQKFHMDELLDISSHQKILHLPCSDYEANVIRLFRSWLGSLNAYSIQISTGPVVCFRAKRFIHGEPTMAISLAPLYWLHNASQMRLTWPLHKIGKGEYIEVCEKSLSLLIPNKNYIFLRRFSSKDDKSRLVATPYFADTVEADVIGVENHLNYIYRPSGHLDRNEIIGLAALLNSSLFDTYFRTFNGNINVSATELREMPLPPLETIKQIGNTIILKNEFTQPIVDEVVSQVFEMEKELVSTHE